MSHTYVCFNSITPVGCTDATMSNGAILNAAAITSLTQPTVYIVTRTLGGYREWAAEACYWDDNIISSASSVRDCLVHVTWSVSDSLIERSTECLIHLVVDDEWLFRLSVEFRDQNPFKNQIKSWFMNHMNT